MKYILCKEYVRTSQRTQLASIIKFTVLILCEKQKWQFVVRTIWGIKIHGAKNAKFIVLKLKACIFANSR
jgi:hypothetical protein